MKTIKNLTFTALAALAVALLFQTSITQADDRGQRGDDNERGDRDHRHHRDAKVTFTKCVTFLPPGGVVRATMAGEVGGDVGDGIFSGVIVGINVMDLETGITKIEALYHFEGPEHSFTALVHIEQTGPNAVIIGVVTDGWLKGHAVEGEFTRITPANCFEGTLEIKKHSND